MARILIVEDKASMRGMLTRILKEHDLCAVADLTEALERMDSISYDLLLTDVRLPDGSGLDLVGASRARHPGAEVIVMTAYATVESAVEAIQGGAYDYLAKPFEPDDLLLKVSRALERHALQARAESAERALRTQRGLTRLLGRSAPMERVHHLISRVCDLRVTVLLTGESGTGKEVAARAIHDAGPSPHLPFVAVNCGAIPAHLIESELFGHARGAFTGAEQSRAGLVEEAGEGTLLLDEIGDLPLDLQVKLNRALQEQVFRRVGESKERPLRARIIAATHRDLTEAVSAGRFRQDLYFRLNVFPIPLPPLRERGADLLLLATELLERAGRRFSREVSGFTPEALAALESYSWPGNVRELGHAIERAVILAPEGLVPLEALPPEVTEGRQRDGGGGAPVDLAQMSYREVVAWGRERTLRQYIEAVLRRFEGNVTRAARHAGIERESFHRLLRRAGLEASVHRSAHEAKERVVAR